MATAGFEKAAFLQNIGMFHKCLENGVDPSTVDFFRRTPLFGLRYCSDASVADFLGILRAFIDAGADINHMDSFGNTLLLMSEVDNLGVALVELGARISYDLEDLSKRGLANAAVHGCTRTIDAMVSSRLDLPTQIQQKDFDSCFDQAAKTMALDPYVDDMTGIVKLVVDYGANPNKWSTLHYCVRSNHCLVTTLISLGARTDTLAWDFYRGAKNTPLHRITDMGNFGVFQALFEQDSCDVNARDGSGATPLMSLMKVRSHLHSDNAVMTRVNWLMERGASCLPVDNKGTRVCKIPRSKLSPFKEVISAKIKEENWLKRRGMVLMRHRLLLLRHSVSGKRYKRDERDCFSLLVDAVAGLNIDGILRHIVTFM